MEYLVIAVLLAVILVFLKFTFSNSGKTDSDAFSHINKPVPGQGQGQGTEPASSKFCPLCSSALGKGENVFSKVYPRGETDRIMEVYGCLYCRPPGGKKERICPVCRKSIPSEGYLLGRYFVKPGKRHLHVLGCTLCRRG